MSVIETRRLYLTPLVVEDADKLADTIADPQIYEFIGGRPDSIFLLRERYKRLAVATPDDPDERWLNWVIREKSTGSVIGTVQATMKGEKAEVAWIVGVEWQGQGYAKESALGLVAWLRGLGVAVVTANIHPNHAASAAVAAAVGLAPTEDEVDGEVVWRS